MAGGKKTGASKGAKRRPTAEELRELAEYEEKQSALRKEIGLIVLFACMLLLFLCNFGLIGNVGKFVSRLMFGLFGLTAYLFPVVVAFGYAFYLANAGNRVAYRKLAAGTAFFLLLGILCELLGGGLTQAEGYHPIQLFLRPWSDVRTGGGILGGSAAYLLYRLLSMIGTVLVLIVLSIVCIVVMTEKSFIGGVKRGGRRVAERTKQGADKYREYRKSRRDERAARAEDDREDTEEALLAQRRAQTEAEAEQTEEETERIPRREHKVSGVAMDTQLPRREDMEEAATAREELREITAEEVSGESADGVYERENAQTASERDADLVREETPTKRVNSLRGDRQEEDFALGGAAAAGAAFSALQTAGGAAGEDFFDLSSMEKPEADGGAESRKAAGGAAGEDFFDLSSMEKSEADGGNGSLKADGENGSLKASGGNGFGGEIDNGNRPDTANKGSAANAGSDGASGGAAARAEAKQPPKPPYRKPDTTLLNPYDKQNVNSGEELAATAKRLEETLAIFGVNATVTDISKGPSVTRYELQPEQGVKVSKIVALSDDLKLNLAATDIRIEAPIPGKAAVGIEVPNKENSPVFVRELLESREFAEAKSNLTFVVGKDIGGKVVVADIAKMPHMLIAGSTGSGKSVCINTILMSLLYKALPEDVKLILVDPKVVELSVYNGIPHLLLPVVTDPKKALSALQWSVTEMMDRYKKFADEDVRDLASYNAIMEKRLSQGAGGDVKQDGGTAQAKKLPQIVIIVDELADLMMVASKEVEEAIIRLTQLARAAGIHLIIATQRPSVDVITGLIKANMPSRVAFAVSSGVDSRTILDMTGAEKLLGKGDMLFHPQGYPKPARVQGGFVSDDEVKRVIQFIKNQVAGNVYDEKALSGVEKAAAEAEDAQGGGNDTANGRDELFAEAGRLIIEKDKASIGMLQRYFRVGFNRAARLMDQLADAGVVGEEEGTKPRRILMSEEEFSQIL